MPRVLEASPAPRVRPAHAGANAISNYAEFYALMPPDNPGTVAPGTDVNFPQNGPTSGTIVRTFILPAGQPTASPSTSRSRSRDSWFSPSTAASSPRPDPDGRSEVSPNSLNSLRVGKPGR